MSERAHQPVPHMTPEEFRVFAHRAVDYIADYLEEVERYPVLSRAKPGEVFGALPAEPPMTGDLSFEALKGDLDRIIMPGLTHWQSPNFFAFFPANASGPSIVGELLAAGLGVQGMLWATSPACTELETRVLEWLGGMIGLPRAMASSGVIQGTASEATLVALVAGRSRVLRAKAVDPARLRIYTSTQAHSSIIKAAMIAGLADSPEDRSRLRLIDVDAHCRMRADALHRALAEDVRAGCVPAYICATVGTTSSTAIDPVPEIAAAIDAACAGCAARPWLHVDAAHLGAAAVCPEHQGMFAGVERADSVAFNPHKWLLTNFDCDCFWTSDRAALTAALSVTPEYLRNAASDAGAVIDYRDWQIPLGRRFRALKLWLVIRHYGVEGLRAYIREHLRLTALFESLVAADARFEVAAVRPASSNLVCFRLRAEPADADARAKALLDRVNATGKAYLTHTTLPGVGVVLRMAIGASGTREEHVRAAWRLIQSCVD